jgi:hypothetical protein
MPFWLISRGSSLSATFSVHHHKVSFWFLSLTSPLLIHWQFFYGFSEFFHMVQPYLHLLKLLYTILNLKTPAFLSSTFIYCMKFIRGYIYFSSYTLLLSFSNHKTQFGYKPIAVAFARWMSLNLLM